MVSFFHEKWHALSNEEYFLKYRFLDVSRCAFNYGNSYLKLVSNVYFIMGAQEINIDKTEKEII